MKFIRNLRADFPPAENFFTILCEQFSQLQSLYKWKGEMTIPKQERFSVARGLFQPRSFAFVYRFVLRLYDFDIRFNRTRIIRQSKYSARAERD
jgi:hypothetical protein